MRKNTSSNRPEIPPIPDHVKHRLRSFRSVPILAPMKKPKYTSQRCRMSNTSKDKINLLSKLSKRKLPNRLRLSVDGVVG